MDRVFETRRTQTAERIRRRLDESVGADAPFLDRVRELAVIQDEQGYLCGAELSADGTIRLREHNCAIYHVAADDPAACEAELELFRDVLDADVVRETHIAAGDRCCTYRISARPRLASQASSRSTSTRRAGSRTDGITSVTFGTNEAARAVAIAWR